MQQSEEKTEAEVTPQAQRTKKENNQKRPQEEKDK